MGKNKSGKYFKYAIGEIVLVVIGILIALSINNWNENRKHNVQEIQYLKRFKNDLLKNKTELTRVLEKTEKVYQSSDSILRLNRHELDSLPLTNFVGCFMNATGFTVFQTQEGTIQDIIGSGNLDIIKNIILRRAIGSWDANLKNIREWEVLNKNSSNDYMDYLYQNYNMYKIENRESPIDENTKLELTNDKIFLNYMTRRKRLSEVLNKFYLKELPKLDALLKEIENVL